MDLTKVVSYYRICTYLARYYIIRDEIDVKLSVEYKNFNIVRKVIKYQTKHSNGMAPEKGVFW